MTQPEAITGVQCGYMNTARDLREGEPLRRRRRWCARRCCRPDSDDHVGGLGESVDHLPFPFVTPLGTEDDGGGHDPPGRRSGDASGRLRCEAPSGIRSRPTPLPGLMDSIIEEALEAGGPVDITTTGRKSGAPRRKEIFFHTFDGEHYISGRPGFKRDWLANLVANPRFTLPPEAWRDRRSGCGG